MNDAIYQLEFPSGVRFGNGTLDSTEITFHADTLFSALFQEALKLCVEKEMLGMIQEGNLLFSDAFPYIEKEFYIPKPFGRVEISLKDTRGDSVQKKQYKKMKYIPVNYVDEFLQGKFPEEHLADLDKLGKHDMRVSVAIEGNEEPMPYRVSSFLFHENAGLYIVLAYEREDCHELFRQLIESLSYSGIGGKRSSGMGRFEFLERMVPKKLEEKLTNSGKRYMLLSTALPEDTELEKSMEDANYMLLKRSGFIHSDIYADQQMKKKDLYVFSPGSCFQKKFKGQLLEERNGGSHSIFRYEKALFLGVDL